MHLMAPESKQIWIVRHAETQWSATGRHTGRTDVPLTTAGEEAADRLAPLLGEAAFGLVLSSPLGRGMETARRSGFGSEVHADEDLVEWDYGQYEGRRTEEIHAERPGWDLWRDGCPGGESIDSVARRAMRVLARCTSTNGHALLFSHGHFSRMLAAVWLQLPPTRGRSFALKAGSISILSLEHGNPVILAWDRVATFEGH